MLTYRKPFLRANAAGISSSAPVSMSESGVHAGDGVPDLVVPLCICRELWSAVCRVPVRLRERRAAPGAALRAQARSGIRNGYHQRVLLRSSQARGL